MYISEIVTTVPDNVKERAPLEQKVYQVEIGLAKGKKLYDKRQDIAKKDQQREASRDFKIRNFG